MNNSESKVYKGTNSKPLIVYKDGQHVSSSKVKPKDYDSLPGGGLH